MYYIETTKWVIKDLNEALIFIILPVTKELRLHVGLRLRVWEFGDFGVMPAYCNNCCLWQFITTAL